jgi:hypothetical protein
MAAEPVQNRAAGAVQERSLQADRREPAKPNTRLKKSHSVCGRELSEYGTRANGGLV